MAYVLHFANHGVSARNDRVRLLSRRKQSNKSSSGLTEAAQGREIRRSGHSVSVVEHLASKDPRRLLLCLLAPLAKELFVHGQHGL